MTVPNKCSQTGPTYYHMGARCIRGLTKMLREKQADHSKTKDVKRISTQCPLSPYIFGLRIINRPVVAGAVLQTPL